MGVAVDLRDGAEMEEAIQRARQYDSRVLLESYHPGLDLRIVVIGYEVVAAAVRRPAEVIGDGRTRIGALIEKQSRRRQPLPVGRARSRWTRKPSAACVTPVSISTAYCPRASACPCGAPPTCTPAVRWRTAQLRCCCRCVAGWCPRPASCRRRSPIEAEPSASSAPPARPRPGAGHPSRRPSRCLHSFHRVAARPPSTEVSMTAQLPEPDLNYMQRVLLEMLAIPSPTGFTDTIVRYVAERLTELGIPFELTRRGTIRATLRGAVTAGPRGRRAWTPSAPSSARFTIPAAWAWRRWVAGRAASPRAAASAFSPIPGDPRQRLAAAGLRPRFQHRGGRGSGQLGPRRAAPGRLYLQPQRDLCAGVNVGDFVAFDPMPEFTESGYISARHLDDKAGVAALLAALKAIVESGREPPIDVHPLFTITEETGSGAAGALPWDVSEFVGIDIAPAAKGQASANMPSPWRCRIPAAPMTSTCRAICSSSQPSTRFRYAATCSLLPQRCAIGRGGRARYPYRVAGVRLRRHPWVRAHPHRQPSPP